MAKYGYGAVSDRAFVAFETEIEHGAWGDIGIAAYDAGDQSPSEALAHASVETVWKLRLRWSTLGLAAVLGGVGDLTDLDLEWDRLQRRIDAQVTMHDTDSELEVREAARRVRAAMLSGTGTAQTGFSYAAEVDFGRSQVSLGSKAPLSDDVEILGLTETLAAISEATEKFAAAQGLGSPTVKTSASRSAQLRVALLDCVTAFNAVHEAIDWTLEHTPQGEERRRLEALRAPLQALLDRHPIVPMVHRVASPLPDPGPKSV